MSLTSPIKILDDYRLPDKQALRPKTPVALLVLSTILFLPLGSAAVAYEIRARKSTDRKTALRYTSRATLLAWYALGVAATLAAVVFLVLVFVLNDFAVAKDYLNPVNLAESMPGVLKAFGQNLGISVVAFAASLLWALILAMVRGLPGPAAAPVRMLATAYIDIFRGLPSLLTILVIAFGLPQTGLPFVSNLGVYGSGVLALTMLNGAYLAEVLRASIESIHASQITASRALGLTYWQTMRFIVLPQAGLNVVPPLLSWYISILKETSLLSVVGLLEAVNVAQIMVTNQSNLSAMTGVALCFLVITIPLSRLADYLVQKTMTSRLGGR